MSFFGFSFGHNADIDILLDDQENRKMADIRDENGRKERLYLFYDGEAVSGKVNVTLHRRSSKLEHQGIRIEFIGHIELYYDRGNHHEFISLFKELARPGEITQNTSFDFEFNQVEKPFECYTGANVRLRYFLRVTVTRRVTDMVKELDLLVHTLATYPEMNNPIKMEVGIEECLHIEFEYNKSKYHLKDVIVGKIYFLLVRIKIKHMEVAIIKRETTGTGPNTFNDNETIAKYEIMDGAPVRGESIPIRVFLAGYDLTPTMRDVNKKFSVRYFLNLVLVDEEERRYFKQQEITLWRKAERPRKPYSLNTNAGPLHHAMARHTSNPSQGIRTAPTPSNPNTPVVSERSSYGQFEDGVEEQQFRDDDAEGLLDPSVYRERRDTSPHQMIREDDDNNSEPEFVTHEDVKQDQTNNAPPLSTPNGEELSPANPPDTATPPSRGANANTINEEELANKLSNSEISDAVDKETVTSPKNSSPKQSAASKPSRIDDDDDRPQPPDDDTVPEDDSLADPVVLSDDELHGNDDL